MRHFLTKTFKVVGIVFFGILLVFLVLINLFFKPKSDEEIRSVFSENETLIYIENQNFSNKAIRVISSQKELDTTLPNFIFVHGSPGSALDFKRYFFDTDLNSKANLIAYDRVGYAPKSLGAVQTISFEADFLNSISSKLNISNTILVGYSYGGPIALASKKEYKKIVICAPAVYSEVEPMFWFLNFYKWKATRWLLPDLLKAASKEKLQHREDLKKFELKWNENPSEILAIHGDDDWIVPYSNSEYLEQQFSKEKFKILTLEDAGHELIWSRFDEIKSALLKVIKE